MRISRLSLAAALLTFIASAAIPSAFAKASPLAGCTLPPLDTSAATHHAVSFTEGGITATDDWEAVQLTCKSGATRAVKITTKTAFKGEIPMIEAHGKLTGPIVLGYSFGAGNRGSVTFASKSTYTCTGGTCEFKGTLTRVGKQVGTFSGKFNPTTQTLSFNGLSWNGLS